MRYRIAALLLFAGIPTITVLAAPAPEPSAILDIGPPEKGEARAQHCKREIRNLDDRWAMMSTVWRDLKGSKLPSIVARKDPRAWLAQNIRITKEDAEGRRLRLTFVAGNRTEQVAILNSVLQVYLQRHREERILFYVKNIDWDEKCIVELGKRIDSVQDPRMAESYKKGINDLRSIHIPKKRAEVARLKQIAVIKWAK
jgi:hypothetical protein